MFMATARIDAVWIHDGIVDARDYKTGGKWVDAVSEINAAHVQAFVLAARARARRATGSGCATSTCSPRSTRIPKPWELDDETLAAVEEELRAAVERMWAEEEWRGVNDDRRRAAHAATDRSVATAPRRASPRGRC